MKKLPEMPCPQGWNKDEWNFKVHRLEICYNCDSHFIDNVSDDPLYMTGNRLVCGECSCSSYRMCHDIHVQRCPLKKWPLWEDWEKIKVEKK